MENESCYGGGDIAGAIFGTLVAVILVAVLLWWLYKKNYILKRKDPQLVTDDPEATAKGGEYAFDNPAFKTDGGVAANSAAAANGISAPSKTGSPLDPSWTSKQNTIEKRKTVDDSYVNVTTPRLVSLRGSDFTGLGVEVYGGLKEGIFVKKVMPQGPAAGIVNTGDRITSITIDFRHIVQEDAMTILSYASPYNVQLELVSGTKPVLPQTQSPKPGHQSLTHPLYRSSSQSDLNTIERNSRKKLFPGEDASPLKMDNRPASPSNAGPLPTVHKENEREPKKHSFKQQMREMIEEKFQTKHASSSSGEVERKGSGAADEAAPGKKSGHKFGIRVFPPSVNDKLFGSKSPTKMQADNENNSNIEKKESDDKKVDEKEEEGVQQPSPPVVKKRTKADHKLVPDVVMMQQTPAPRTEVDGFQRQNSLTSSGIRRDAAGIPQEMPSFMMQAANAARDNRKSMDDGKRKGKAPPRPPQNESELDESTVTVDTNLSSIDGSRTMLNGSMDMPDTRTVQPRMNFSDNFAEEVLNCTIDSINGIEQFNETGPSNSSTPKSDRKKTSSLTESELMMRSGSPAADDNESDVEQEQRIHRQQHPPPTPPRRDGNKIELNAEDITVHRSSPSPAPPSSSSTSSSMEENEEQEETNRRTASLGDLSKFEPAGKTNQTSSNAPNTLERAQSLEITGDASVVTVVNGSTVGGDLAGNVMDGGRKRKISSEIILDGVGKESADGMSSLQRHRLKGASAWGNLEDAINSGELLANGDGEVVTAVGTEKREEQEAQVTVKQNGYTELSMSKAIIVAEAPKNNRSEVNEHDREEHISLTTISMNFAGAQEQEPDTNIPDDVKVSRYPFGSLERPKSDVLKKLLGQKEELENTPSVFISADGGESAVSTIKIESKPDVGEPISLTLINAIESDRTESGQPSPVFTSGSNGVSSINISSMDYGIVPSNSNTGSILLNGVGSSSTGMTKFSLTADNIVTISTALDDVTVGTESQPSSIVMIDDEKLDFSLQTLDDFDDPLDAPPPPPIDFNSDNVPDHADPEEPVPKLTNGGVVVTSETAPPPPQPPQRSSIALGRRDSSNGPAAMTNGGFVTEITLKAPEPPTAAERLPQPSATASQQNGTSLPVIASKPPIVSKKPPKPEMKPTTPPSRIPVERRMSNEHGTGSLIPRNTEIKFSTAPYESSSAGTNNSSNKTPTRGVDQIRSTFERSNSKTEIPVLIRRTSIPSINLSPSASATGGSMSNLSSKASPSRIPVFNSSSNGSGSSSKLNGGGSSPPPSQNGGHTNGLYRSNSNSTIMNHHHHNNHNNNNNHLVNSKMAVSITSIKNQAKHPSGKF
ncbi:histone acetyltransferase KAT6A-like [Anopheles maculipalpis]|uniref:histone acetyltransferase KAT6A-like n=1 Tax=Anopheles maculipalpis TaxID=1496333 RepID=UPI0021591EA4|nr:histone acetyltransferase KAT6A-like [Anopheles maculipalpis]